MSESGTDRRVLDAIAAVRERARSQADFTAAAVAAEAGISVAWLYRAFGAEFKRVRSTLAGPRKAESLIVAELRRENRRLRAENRELSAKAQQAVLPDAVRRLVTLNEQFDQDNTRLKDELRYANTRLRVLDATTDVVIAAASEPIRLHPRRLWPVGEGVQDAFEPSQERQDVDDEENADQDREAHDDRPDDEVHVEESEVDEDEEEGQDGARDHDRGRA